MSDALASRLASVQARIREAATAAGRDPDALTTIVVTKFHPAELVRRLAALGVREVGESRHQDAAPKAAELADLGLRWHFIGQLQTKKARQVRAYADVIHSVDRVKLVDALADESSNVDCFVQLNLGENPARGGVAPGELEPLVERVLVTPGLTLLGVMAVAPLGENPESAFERLRSASQRVTAIAPDARAISAGMSQDFAVAIAHGATHLRIGTAITGNRPAHG